MLNPAALYRARMFSIWTGIHYCVLATIGWWLVAGFVPPMSPSMSAEEVAAVFQEDTTRIRIGMIITMFAALIIIPFSAAIARVLARLEGGYGVLAGSALLGGAGTMVLTFYPAVWWLVTAYRPERAPELILLFNDMSWLQFIGGVSMYFALPLSIAYAAFNDKSENPVFPRWAGYANIWIVIGMIPGQIMFFVHGGPFAWNGVIGFWIPLTVFFGWFLLTFYLLRADEQRGHAEATATAARPSTA